MSIDKIFGPHEQAIELRARRAEILASNLVNADTPGYKSRDIDFKEVLSALKDNQADRLVTTNPMHLKDDSLLLETDVKYRIPLQTKADGNTVDTHVENTKYAENNLRYLASLRFLDHKIKNAIMSVRGD